jgi:hypothetical protein
MWYQKAFTTSLIIGFFLMVIGISWFQFFVISVIIFGFYYLGNIYQLHKFVDSKVESTKKYTDLYNLPESFQEDLKYSEKIQQVKNVLIKNYTVENIIELLMLKKKHEYTFLQSILYLSDLRGKTKEYIDVISEDSFFTKKNTAETNILNKTKYFIYFIYNNNRYCFYTRKERNSILSVAKNYFSDSKKYIGLYKHKIMLYFNSRLVFESILPIKKIKLIAHNRNNEQMRIIQIFNSILSLFNKKLVSKRKHISVKDTTIDIYENIDLAKLGDWVIEIYEIKKMIIDHYASIDEELKKKNINEDLNIKEDIKNKYEKKKSEIKKNIEKDFDIGDF